jgi:CubicO group peptidase (beta-lactamase class C family)
MVAVGAVGATTNALWHLGSNTKAMTATLIAKLVEQEKLKWDTSVGEVFPDAPKTLRQVTVLHLLSHRAGLPANAMWGVYGLTGRPVQRQRRSVLMGTKTKSAPGEKYLYSNLGYVVAGALAEEATGTAWEDLIRKHVFLPLGMKSAGFGPVGSDQPCGHTAKGKPTPGADNPPVLGPAGRVHCALEDWSKFIADLLRGLRGGRALLRPEHYRTIVTPPFGGNYALGWMVWRKGEVLTHGGSNTMNYSGVWVSPKRGFAVLVCTNQGGEDADRACDEAAGALIRVVETSGLGSGRSSE